MPIRVLHILSFLEGGMASLVVNYMRNFDTRKVIFDFLLIERNGLYEQEVLAMGSRLFYLTPRRENFRKHCREVRTFFEEHPEYRIVHIHQSVRYLYPLEQALRHHVPHRIVHSHGLGAFDRKYLGPYIELYAKPRIARLGTYFFSCSGLVATHMFNRKVLQGDRFRVLPNAVDTAGFEFNATVRQEVREELKISSTTFVVGHVGCFLPVKNHSFLIDIFKEIQERENDSLLLLVGTGPLGEEMKNKARALGLQDRVRFLGRSSRIAELLQAMDVFVMPSFYEGLPVAGVEAQSAGLPCFFSDTITREVFLTEPVRFLSLQSAPTVWAAEILKSLSCVPHREMGAVQVKANGFDVKSNAEWLQALYFHFYNSSQ